MGWTWGVSACSQSHRRHLASGRPVWCDLSLEVAGLEVDQVAKRRIGVDPSPGALWALTRAADEARLWLASGQLVCP
jgi:hypothetical protein